MSLEELGVHRFLEQFTPLIHRTLQRLSIYPQNMDYEDYYQELQIKLMDILRRFKIDSADLEEVNAKFTAFAGRGLYWHGLDLVRSKKNQSLASFEPDQIERLEDEESREEQQMERKLSTEDFFRLAKKRLSEKDFQLLLQFASGNYRMQDLADEYGVARDTIYQWKNKIQIRLADLKDCLMD